MFLKCVYFLLISIRPLGFFSSASIIIPIVIIMWIILCKPDQLIGFEKVSYSQLSFKNICFAYGIIIFLYASVATYPSLQMDMKRKDKFGKALLIGTIGS